MAWMTGENSHMCVSVCLWLAVCLCVSASECPPVDLTLGSGVPVGAARGNWFLSASSWRFELLPPVPHSVLVWACFALSRANKPVLEQVRQPARQEGSMSPLCLQPVLKQARPHDTAIKYKFYKHHGTISIELLHRAVLQLQSNFLAVAAVNKK